MAGLSAFGLSRTFPRPAALAEANLGVLGLGPSSRRAVRAFARAVSEGSLKLGRENRWRMLNGAVPGMSAETASSFALHLGEPDAFPCASSRVPAPACWVPSPRAEGHAVTPE